ncbi:pectin lyase B [Plectosphaerella cucumerina]|uniref:pectin lyase n=1 Tax=Plectosphaerella cucumerina TaxID=40658 RepID=A0A8K0TIW3_9PEZI|nr:pectin lyase B [Plectosphaerella cucumerina]
MRFSAVALLLGAPSLSLAQVVGKAYGFAAGVTGGGSAAPAVPKDIAQLKAWLADDVPRTIRIDKTFNFIGSEGSVTEMGCREKTLCTAAGGGQDWIKPDCDSNQTPFQVKYDKAGTRGMDVGSNKSIIGVGNKGVLLGKGLRLKRDAKNVIIQNIHIDNLNPSLIWGGDAIDLTGNNNGVWIDHCKFSRIGRQMFVSHFNSGNTATLSNNEFDGRTTNTRTCNGDHYWTIMIVGTLDKITFDRNYLHDVSGRAPKIGSTDGVQIVQATNNWYSSNTGHAFDISFAGAKVLLEGNRFENQPQALTSASSVAKVFNVHTEADRTLCASLLGRNCEINALTATGSWPRRADNSVLQELAKYRGNLVTPLRYGDVKGHVSANYGIGRF